MLKLTLLFFISVIFRPNIYGQLKIYVENQKNFEYSDSFILNSLYIKKPNFDSIDLQIRITISNAASGIHKKFIIEKQKSGTWKGNAVEFYYYNDDHYDFNITTSNKLLLGEKWESAFKTIVFKDYINLPSQREVEKFISATNKDSVGKMIMVTADGISYTYEFLTKKNKRKFIFRDPESYYQFNKEQHNDTRYFEMCIDLLNISRTALDLSTTKSQLIITSANKGFSAMLADEYMLIVPFAIQLHHGATFLRNVNRSLFSISISNYL